MFKKSFIKESCHGQASIEKGFTLNKSILESNMKEESIVGRKPMRDHMLVHSPSPESFVITKPLITFCLSVHRKYQELLKSVKNVKEHEKVSNEMKNLMEEVNDTEANHEKLVKIIESLKMKTCNFLKSDFFFKWNLNNFTKCFDFC